MALGVAIAGAGLLTPQGTAGPQDGQRGRLATVGTQHGEAVAVSPRRALAVHGHVQGWPPRPGGARRAAVVPHELVRVPIQPQHARDPAAPFDHARGHLDVPPRLALIVALLEDRPIYIFDEWAADQDPEFRRYFYERLLPDLAARGKTIVAVTHDERYLHVAHRVITMDFGRVVHSRGSSILSDGQPGAS